MSSKGNKGGTAVEKPKASAIAQVPDFMKADAGKGTENLSSRDVEMPRISLMQGLSDEVNTYDGVKVGDFFHTIAEASLGNELTIVPIFISKRFMLWNPRHAGGGILARAEDGVHWQPPEGTFRVKAYKDRDTLVEWKLAPTVAASKLDQWGTYDPSDPKSQPAATECYVAVVALPDYPELSPVALLLQRTALGPAKKLIGKLKMTQAPSYGMRFTMSSFEDERPSGKFKNYRFTAAGFVTDQAEYNAYKELNEHFVREGVKIKDIENAQDEGGANGIGGAVGSEADAGKGESY